MNERVAMIMKKLGVCCFFAVSAAFVRAQPELRAAIEKLLPPVECKVDIMDVVFPKRCQELAGKMQLAVAINKEWYLNYIKENANRAGPLPYDERMGLTKDEYAEFFSLAEKREMQKIGSTELRVTTNTGIFEFHGGKSLPDLDGVKIDFKNLAITTPFAVITNPKPNTSETGGVIGPFSGYEWKFEEADKEFNNVTTASFMIGQAKKTGRNYIYYKGTISKSKNVIANTMVLIFYDKPK
jgi:hypothetical protein